MRAFIRNAKTIGFHASRVSPSSVPYRTIWTLEPEPVELVKEGPRPHPDLQKLEALRLYREIIRTAKHFTWPDKDGIAFSEKLIKSARNEFEQARYEKDPELIARLLIGGREAMEKVTDRMAAKAHKIVQDEQRNTGQTAQAGMTFEQSNDLYWKQDFAQRHDNWVLQKEQANSNHQKDWAKLQQPGAQSPWKNWASKK